MKLKQQVVSLKLAKKLKKLGFKQSGLYAYYNNPYHGNVGAKQLLLEYKKGGYSMKEFCCFAYTVAELGEILPWVLEMKKKEWWSIDMPEPKRKAKLRDVDEEEMNFVLIQGGCREYQCYYMEDYDSGCCIFNQTGNSAKKEADARAKILIYLKENNLLK